MNKIKVEKTIRYAAIEIFGQLEIDEILDGPFEIYYDENGNKIKICRYDYDDLSYKYTHKYDEKGNIVEDNSYDSDGSLSSKHTYKYDEKGNIVEDNNYNFDGRLFDSKTTYKYDEKGNMIEETYYDSDGIPDYKYTYKYKSKYTCKYEYDKNNNWTQQVTYENNKPTQIKERIIEYYP